MKKRLILCLLGAWLGASQGLADSGPQICEHVDVLLKRDLPYGERNRKLMDYLESLSKPEFEDFVRSFDDREQNKSNEGFGFMITIFSKCYLAGPARGVTVEEVIAEATNTDGTRPLAWQLALANSTKRLMTKNDATTDRLESIYNLWERGALSELPSELRIECALKARSFANGMLLLATKRFGDKAPSVVIALRADDTAELKKLLGDEVADVDIKRAAAVCIRTKLMLHKMLDTFPDVSKENDRLERELSSFTTPIAR